MAKKIENLNTEKTALIEEAIGKIEKEYGKGSIVRLGDKSIAKMDVIPTQCLSLDIALGVGGFPKGRIIEIYGPESSGKTTLALHAIASCQAQGGTVVFIDAEHALDAVYAKNLGVDIDNLYVIQPDSGEQALDNLDTLVRSNSIDLIVVDSVAALTPRAEIEGEVGQSVIGLQARMMSQGLRRITSIISKANTCVIFINQLREKVGVMFGNPETTPGGKALKFYSSIRIDVRKGDAIKDGAEVIGNRTKAKIIKNKVAPPFKVAEFDIYYGKGISQEGSIVDLAISQGIMLKSGSWISYNDEKIAQGRDKAVQYLQDNPEVAKEITAKIMAKLNESESKDVD
ncbi:MAG: recombinase RecA [Christensenella sp.]|nr:recombinase RecA [Christensenella sp.]